MDYAYNGLGEIAYQKKDFPKALRYFTDGTEKIAAVQKLKEISLGRARRSSRSESWMKRRRALSRWHRSGNGAAKRPPCSVYSLGQIAAKRGKWAEANAYFQRVYVGYQKFLPWVAKAYVAQRREFRKARQIQEATNTYRELLRNEKLSDFNEATEARKRLEALGEGS